MSAKSSSKGQKGNKPGKGYAGQMPTPQKKPGQFDSSGKAIKQTSSVPRPMRSTRVSRGR